MVPTHVSGVVVRGLMLGRTLGYPTINIEYSGTLGVKPGVYAARVTVAQGEILPGAAVVGGDFEIGETPKLEVHLLSDEAGERYGESVSVELFMYVSELRKMSDAGMLKEKIAADVAAIRKLF